MKKSKMFLFSLMFVSAIVLTSSCGGGSSSSSDTPTPPTAKPTVFLVGDSTVSEFNDPYYYPRYGYGTQLANYMTSDVTINNLALSGRSSKSFTTEANYTTLTSTIKSGDYLIIAFGHNDEKAGDDSLYTDPTGDSSTAGSFKYYLYNYYIKLAKDKGATPVLCTPIVRRVASTTGTYTGTSIHVTTDSVVGTVTYKGGDYSAAIIALAGEQSVPYVDLTTLTKTLHTTLGIGTDATALLHAWLFLTPKAVDNTHTNLFGASYNAYLFANALSTTITPCTLKNYVKSGITAPLNTMLVGDASHTYPPSANPPTIKSTIWTTTGSWWGSAFGDVAAVNTTNFTITETSTSPLNVSMRSGSSTSSIGKISTTSDGLAMYFQAVPIATNFTLSATATVVYVNNTNSQVAFGLMVRDAVWIDTADATLISNYVACGPYKMNVAAWQTSFTRDLAAVPMQGGTSVVSSTKPAAGSVINMVIVKSGSTYTVTYGSEAPVTYTVDLGFTDSTNVYPGVFTSRAAEVNFSNITLTIN
jgi:lysophospholipase L1-like esterase